MLVFLFILFPMVNINPTINIVFVGIMKLAYCTSWGTITHLAAMSMELMSCLT
jgi:hypothetical protein